jgi:hypothetical protein
MQANNAEITGGIIRDLITMHYGRSGSVLVQGEDMRGESQACSCLRVFGTHTLPAAAVCGENRMHGDNGRDGETGRQVPRSVPTHCGKLSPTHAPTGTTDAAVQVGRACTTFSCRLRPHCVALPPAASPALGSRVPSGDAVTLPNLAGDYGLSHSRIGVDCRVPLLPFCLVITSRRINLTMPY